ncbi:hypothetical protein [Streptomyces aidingensis]|uniref:Uncharacterized protein n=1 Tax=Streptomyces aidingensis TaxID=910347 RepID=A0A1I1KT04_9ACTN|nr:hypothetical protein [Streptomyces aidingensis]SFC61283.1 hypothetical protein SAMN05421773_104273 [Streptomyces aidingensis]
MAEDLRNTVAFKALTAQAGAVLLTRDMQVEPVALQGVVAHLIATIAKRIGMDEEEALHLVTPEAVADTVDRAIAEEGAPGPAPFHAIRPVRHDTGTVPITPREAGRMVMAAAQAAKCAGLNDHTSALATHALDLITELGAALSSAQEDEAIELSAGLLEELASTVESVAARMEAKNWSTCPCGERHDQGELDAGIAASMHTDSAFVRFLIARPPTQ